MTSYIHRPDMTPEDLDEQSPMDLCKAWVEGRGGSYRVRPGVDPHQVRAMLDGMAMIMAGDLGEDPANPWMQGDLADPVRMAIETVARRTLGIGPGETVTPEKMLRGILDVMVEGGEQTQAALGSDQPFTKAVLNSAGPVVTSLIWAGAGHLLRDKGDGTKEIRISEFRDFVEGLDD